MTPHAQVDDWRSDAEREQDARLAGAWWRCSVHGLTERPYLAGDEAFCPDDDCDLRALLVHTPAGAVRYPAAPVAGPAQPPEPRGEPRRAEPQPVRGTMQERLESLPVEIRRGPFECAVCQRVQDEPHVTIVGGSLEVPVCAPCAAEGDKEMRAAAAPLLRARSRALGPGRCSRRGA